MNVYNFSIGGIALEINRLRINYPRLGKSTADYIVS